MPLFYPRTQPSLFTLSITHARLNLNLEKCARSLSLKGFLYMRLFIPRPWDLRAYVLRRDVRKSAPSRQNEEQSPLRIFRIYAQQPLHQAI